MTKLVQKYMKQHALFDNYDFLASQNDLIFLQKTNSNLVILSTVYKSTLIQNLIFQIRSLFKILQIKHYVRIWCYKDLLINAGSNKREYEHINFKFDLNNNMGQYSSQATSHLISNWQQLDKQPEVLVNLLTNDHIHRHRILVKNQEQIRLYLNRMKEHYSYICKVIYYHPEIVQDTPNQSITNFPEYFYVYTDRIIPIKNWTLQLAQMIMKGFRKLFATYGSFRVQPSMLGQNQKGQAKVWIHTNPAQNHPMSQANTQQQMLADLVGIIMQSQKSIAGLLIGCKTFSQALRTFVQAHRQKTKAFESNANDVDSKQASGKNNYQHYSHRGDKYYQRQKNHQRLKKLQIKKQVVSKNSSNANQYMSNRFADINLKSSQSSKNEQANNFGEQIPNFRNFITNYYRPTGNPDTIAKQQKFENVKRQERTIFSPQHFGDIVDANQRHLSFNPVKKYDGRSQQPSMERPINKYLSQEKGKQFQSFHQQKPYQDQRLQFSSQIKVINQKPSQYVPSASFNKHFKQTQSLKSSAYITGRLNYQNTIPKISSKGYYYQGKADYRSPQANTLQPNRISEDIFQEQCQSPLLKKPSQSKFNGGTPQFLKYRAPKSQARYQQQPENLVFTHKKQKSKEQNRGQILNDIQIAMKFHQGYSQIRNKTQDFDRNKNVPSFIPKKRQQMLDDNLSTNMQADSIKQQRGDRQDLDDIEQGQQRKMVKKSDVNIGAKLNKNKNTSLVPKSQFKSQKGHSIQQGERKQKRALEQQKKQQIQYYQKQMYRKKRQENNRKFIETMEDYGMFGYKNQISKLYKRTSDKQAQQNNQILIKQNQFLNNYAHYHAEEQTKIEYRFNYQNEMQRFEGYHKAMALNSASKSEYHYSYDNSKENSIDTNSDRNFEQESKRKYKQEMAKQLKMEFGSILQWGSVEEEKLSKRADKLQNKKAINFKSPPKDHLKSQKTSRQNQKLRKQSIQSSNKNQQHGKCKERQGSVARKQEVQRREKIQSIISKYADNVKDDTIKQKVQRKKATFADLKKEALKILSDDLF